MNKSLLEVYALSVCFVSMGCLSIFSGIFLYSLVEIAFPSSMNHSRMLYAPPSMIQYGSTNTAMPPNAITLPEEGHNKIQSHHSEQVNRTSFAIDSRRTEAIMSAVRAIIIILIASIVFIFHWRIAKQARDS